MKVSLEKFGEVEIVNFVDLSIKEKYFILKMRNHPDIKKWMYNKNDILEKEHFDFIKRLEAETTRLYFLIKKQQRIIGSINFSNIILEKSAELGIYSNPFNNKSGSGKILEDIAVQYSNTKLGLRKIYLEVYFDNDRAVNFYKNHGFKVNKIIKNGKIYCMEKALLNINEK